MNYSNSFQEIGMPELLMIDGGGWSFKKFFKAITGGAAGGAVTGAVAGGAGALPGAAVGAAGAGLVYLVSGWW